MNSFSNPGNSFNQPPLGGLHNSNLPCRVDDDEDDFTY